MIVDNLPSRTEFGILKGLPQSGRAVPRSKMLKMAKEKTNASFGIGWRSIVALMSRQLIALEKSDDLELDPSYRITDRGLQVVRLLNNLDRVLNRPVRRKRGNGS